jgi:26S proteasome regulatory subunit T4
MSVEADGRALALAAYRGRLLEHRELEAKVKQLRLALRSFEKEFDKSENDIKALQSVGQIIGEVLKQLDSEKCKST